MNLHNLDAAFHLVWSSSLRACVLIVAVLLIQSLAGKRLPARFRYALSLLVLLRLVVLVTPASSWSVFNLTRHVWPAPASAPIFPSVVSPIVAVAPSHAGPTPLIAHRASPISWGRLAAGGWLCGGAGFVLVVFWRHRKFARWVSSWPTPGDPRLIELVEQCRGEAGLRRTLKIASVPRENSAAVFGFFRPCLLLPEGMMDTLERREARLVVLHELLHIRRRDVLVNWISVLTLAVHWFNPLAWVAMRRLRADQELACDAAVLNLIEHSERGAYGRTLLKHLHVFPAARLAAGLVPLITSRHNIKRRIIMITEFKHTGRLARALFASMFVALGGLTFTRAAEDSNPAAPNTGLPPADVTPSQDTSTMAPPPKAGSDYGAEYVKQSSLLEQLKEMESTDSERFVQALSVTVSDTILNSLLQQEMAEETKLTALKTTFGPDSAPIRGENAVIHELQQKIKRRADGIMLGLSLQARALKAAANDGLRRAPSSGGSPSKVLEDWAHQRVLAKADYLQYSNILFNLNKIPTNELAGALTTAYAHQMDPELIDLADRLQVAKSRMVEAEQSYGPEMQNYKAAKEQLVSCQSAYDRKIRGVMAGIRTRVEEDKGFLELIEQEEKSLKDADEHLYK